MADVGVVGVVFNGRFDGGGGGLGEQAVNGVDGKSGLRGTATRL